MRRRDPRVSFTPELASGRRFASFAAILWGMPIPCSVEKNRNRNRAMSDLPDDLGIPMKPAAPAANKPASAPPLARNPPPVPPAARRESGPPKVWRQTHASPEPPRGRPRGAATPPRHRCLFPRRGGGGGKPMCARFLIVGRRDPRLTGESTFVQQLVVERQREAQSRRTAALCRYFFR